VDGPLHIPETGVDTLHGRSVVVSCGSAPRRGQGLAQRLRRMGADVALADVAGVEAARRFAEAYLGGHTALHGLVLVGADCASHFALARLLLDRLCETGSPSYGPGARVVVVAREGRLGRLAIDKLLFAGELHRLLKDASLARRVQCVAALGDAAALHAVAAPDVRGGDCVGPSGLAGRFGPPGPLAFPAAGRSRGSGERAWKRWVDATGLDFGALRQEAERLETGRLEILAGPRRISAMVRARNEQEFLYPAVKSIVDQVDEVLVVDNLSRDGTPEIIRRLAAEHPDKLVALAYPHRIARQGWEQKDAIEGRGALLPAHEYCNWILERCANPFVLKWDADMVALPAFARWLERWRASDKLVMAFRGVNVHPDRSHLLAARCTDRAQLEAQLGRPGLPEWATSLTYDSVEPRLFPLWEARFDGSWGWVEAHVSPFFFGTQRRRTRLTPDDPCFLHMKFCKRDCFAYYTADMAEVIGGNVAVGPEVSDEQRAALRRWGLDARPARVDGAAAARPASLRGAPGVVR